MPRLPWVTPNTITEITRRDIFDTITMENVAWAGRLDEPDFLDRIWDLADMPSEDRRFKDAAGDIWQHRINNPEAWEADWVFTDGRFDLMHGDDEMLVRILAEMVHPAVRTDVEEARELVDTFNEKLAPDGWVLTGPSRSPDDRSSKADGSTAPSSRHPPSDCLSTSGCATLRSSTSTCEGSTPALPTTPPQRSRRRRSWSSRSAR